ncbi:hypothetical protein ABBQ38_007376 [Trebouxia sp. C0009 RCD-2024]
MRIPARYLLGGAGLYVGVAAATYLRLKSHKCTDACTDQPQRDGQAFNCLADTYDKQVGWDERLMGISLLRRWLIRQAQGDVLEVSAGTGRNLPYYSKAARSLTISDTSKNMLWHARQKHDRYSANLPATFCLADAQNMLHHGTTDAGAPDEALCHSSKVQQPDSTYQDKLQTFSLAQFDTVIDTFGLCSHADPVAALKGNLGLAEPEAR